MEKEGAKVAEKPKETLRNDEEDFEAQLKQLWEDEENKENEKEEKKEAQIFWTKTHIFHFPIRFWLFLQ